MPNRPDDPRHKALAELVHQLRPAWNRAGILAAVHAASGKRTIEALVRAAVDAAFDRTAETPTAIMHRDGAAWADTKTARTPRPVADVCHKCRRIRVVGLDHTCHPPTPTPTELVAELRRTLAAVPPPKRLDQEPTP